MRFALSPERVLMCEQLDGLLAEHASPRRVHECIADGPTHDDRLSAALDAFGFSASVVPETYGGLGLELVDLALMVERLGEHAAPVDVLGQVLATLAIVVGGSDAQRRHWLPQLVDGSLTATTALGDDGGWLPDQWACEIDGERVTGVKRLVPNAGAARLFVVGAGGGRLRLVEADRAVALDQEDGVDRTRLAHRVTFTDAPSEALGDRATADRIFAAASILLAADSFGGARRAVDLAVAHAKDREQFGVKIAQFQALRHQLADMALRVEPLRGLYWYAAHAFDRSPARLVHAAALAKAELSQAYLDVARAMVEAHGGIGFTWEHDAHIWLKRAMFNWAWLGRPQLHRLRAADAAGW